MNKKNLYVLLKCCIAFALQMASFSLNATVTLVAYKNDAKIPPHEIRANPVNLSNSRYQLAPWNLLKLPEFKNAYEKILMRHKNVPVWVKQLDIVSLPTGVPYSTVDGIAWAYEGTKPHSGNISLRLIFIPEKQIIGIRLSTSIDSDVYFGDTRPSVLQLLNLGTPYDYPKDNALYELNTKNPGEGK